MTGPTGATARLMALMQLTDSALPTGAFSHSLGFETYLARDVIRTADDFAGWLRVFVAEQLTYTDALALRLVHAAADFDRVAELDRLVTAQALPRQTRRANATMGARLLTIGSQSYPGPWVDAYARAVDTGQAQGHPALVLGVLTRQLGVAVDEAVAAHLYSTIISLTQNAVRGIPLGQNAGQRVIRAAQEWVDRAVQVSAGLDESDLGAITPGLEIAQMAHERQHARLFMS